MTLRKKQLINMAPITWSVVLQKKIYFCTIFFLLLYKKYRCNPINGNGNAYGLLLHHPTHTNAFKSHRGVVRLSQLPQREKCLCIP